MPHTFGENPAAVHGRALVGVDQGNPTNEGRAVVDEHGRRGRIAPGGAHCTYGATVEWDDGTRYYIDTACLWWADDSTAPHSPNRGQ